MGRFSKPFRPTAAIACTIRSRLPANAAEKADGSPKAGTDEIEHRNRKAAVDIRRLRQIGDVLRLKAGSDDRAGEWLEQADNAAEQRRFAGAVGTDHRDQCALDHLAIQVMHGWMPIVAQGDIAKLQLRRHAHLVASQTMAQRHALTTSAAVRRDHAVIRRIDQDTACAGCGDASPWRWGGTPSEPWS